MAVCGISSNEGDVVRHPPFGDLALQNAEHVLLVAVSPGFEHDDQQRPLVPFGMAHADHRGFGDLGMADRDILHLDRGNPFAARLDDVLGAVGDLHIAVAVDGGDIAGVETAFVVEDSLPSSWK